MNILLRRIPIGIDSCREIQAESTTGLVTVLNDTPIPEDTKLVFRWGCTSVVPKGCTVVNPAVAIHRCFDKRQTRLDMQRLGISVPQTWDVHTAVPADIGEVIFRPAKHACSENLHVVDTSDGGWQEALGMLAEQFPSYYISRRINKVAEYRVAIVQNRVIWVLNKVPENPEDISWGCVEGGMFYNVRWSSWPMNVVELAMKAARYSRTDFCAVDVLVDDEGKAYVLEINTAPHSYGYQARCFSRAFDFIVANGKTMFDTPPDCTSWKAVIHPAIRGTV